jgi:hypothetical protein
MRSFFFFMVMWMLPATAFAAEVSFLAVGYPSALKVRGQCGTAESKVDGNMFQGTLKLDQCDTGNNLRNKHMKEKYIQTAKFPLAKAQLKAIGSGCEGWLEVHGKRASVYDCKVSKEKIEFKTKVSAHGIEIPSFMGITVADEVNVEVKL